MIFFYKESKSKKNVFWVAQEGPRVSEFFFYYESKSKMKKKLGGGGGGGVGLGGAGISLF